MFLYKYYECISNFEPIVFNKEKKWKTVFSIFRKYLNAQKLTKKKRHKKEQYRQKLKTKRKENKIKTKQGNTLILEKFNGQSLK